MAAYLRDVLALGFPLVIGAPVVIGLELADSLVAALGFGFLLGSAVAGLGLMVLGVAGLPLEAPLLAGLLLAWLIATGWLISRRHRDWKLKPVWPSWHPVTIAFVVLAIVNLVTAAVFALRTQLVISDVINLWIPKADMLAGTRSLLSLGQTTFPDYPPLWPLHLFLSRGIAGHLLAVKLLPTLYLVSLLAVVFRYLSVRTNPVVASATSWVISGIPYLWFPYGANDLMAEIPFAVFFIASVLALVRYLEEDDVRFLIAALLLATAATLTRPEGIQHGVLVAVIAGAVAWRRGRRNLVVAGAIVAPLVAYALWHLAVELAPHKRGYAIDPHRILQVATPSAFADIAGYTVHWLGNPFVFGPTVVALALCVAGYRSWQATWPWLTMFALSLGAIAATYLIAPASNDQPLSWWLATGYKRLLAHIVPLVFIAAALAAWSLLRTQRPSPQRPRRWPGFVAAITSTVLVIAAVLTVAIPGPGSVVLAALAPNGVVGTLPLVGRLQGPDTFTQDSGPAAEWIQIQVASTTRASVSYDLSNLGERVTPNDEVVGRFTSLAASVVAAASGNGMRVEAAANNRVIATASPQSSAGPIRLDAAIPPDARTVSLDVTPAEQGSSVQAVWVRAVLNRGGAWPLVALLLILAAIAAVVRALGTPLPDPPPASGGREPSAAALLNPQPTSGGTERRDLGTVVLVALVLLAALIQQADVLTNQAVPLWSEAARTVVHVLRSH